MNSHTSNEPTGRSRRMLFVWAADAIAKAAYSDRSVCLSSVALCIETKRYNIGLGQ